MTKKRRYRRKNTRKIRRGGAHLYEKRQRMVTSTKYVPEKGGWIEHKMEQGQAPKPPSIIQGSFDTSAIKP